MVREEFQSSASAISYKVMGIWGGLQGYYVGRFNPLRVQ